MNAHDAVIDAILRALTASPALAGGRVQEESEFDQVPESADSAISVAMVSSDPNEGLLSGAPVDWMTRVRITSFSRRDARTSAGRASRALSASVYERLMADRSLGGLASDLVAGPIKADSELFATRVGVLHADYIVSHRTDGATLNPIT